MTKLVKVLILCLVSLFCNAQDSDTDTCTLNVYTDTHTLMETPDDTIVFNSNFSWTFNNDDIVYLHSVDSFLNPDIYIEDAIQLNDPLAWLIQCPLVLPVEYGSVEVLPFRYYNVVQWITMVEDNVDYFTVEKSTDGVNFKQVYYVNAKGTDDGSKLYLYIDNDNIGTFYYRIKNVDYDGSFEYSRLLEMTQELPTGYIPISNPVTQGDTTYDGTYRVYSPKGIYLGSKISILVPGWYIIKFPKEPTSRARKIIIK